MAMERTPHEIKIGIPVRCLAVFRALKGELACCPRPDGRWSTDAIVLAVKHDSAGKKARELAVACPDVVEREYLDRADGEIKPTFEECGRPVAMYRLAAKYDPRRPAPPPKPAAIQGVLI